MSEMRTRPTLTASLGISDSASVFARTGNASAARAQANKSCFISKLLSLEAPGCESKTNDSECGSAQKRSGRERRSQTLRSLIAGYEGDHRLSQFRRLRKDPVQSIDEPGLPLLRYRGRNPGVTDQHQCEEEKAVRRHDRHRCRRRDHADQERKREQRGDHEENDCGSDEESRMDDMRLPHHD